MDHADENRIRENPGNIHLQQWVPQQEYFDTINTCGGVLEVQVISDDFTQRRAIFFQYEPRRLLTGLGFDSNFDMQGGVWRCIASARKLLKTAMREKIQIVRARRRRGCN